MYALLHWDFSSHHQDTRNRVVCAMSFNTRLLSGRDLDARIVTALQKSQEQVRVNTASAGRL